MKRKGYTRITKAEWYRAGGFANSRCVRIERGGGWQPSAALGKVPHHFSHKGI